MAFCKLGIQVEENISGERSILKFSFRHVTTWMNVGHTNRSAGKGRDIN